MHYFCLQHKREIKEYSSKAGRRNSALGDLAVTVTAKKLLKKKF